jgi:eukaryotic-like serine/threonine-protein kinase
VSLSLGVHLGPYKIVSAIGAGGMGEVYRAHDPRLGRDVAIKVLPAAFSADPDRLRRFDQEARAAAALNHPNILTVHEVGTHDGQPYVVSELLEGRTLREALSRGALPTKSAIEYVAQICRGLAAAHQKAIVHRDLKPENLFVTNDGRVKILDFGLAKLTEVTAPPAGATLATTHGASTSAGIVLGSVGYMSPEQVRAQSVDHLSDIFNLGAILYEMLSGARAFSGDTAADTMSAILGTDPPQLTTGRAHVSPGLERIVRRCLEKLPAQRFQSASDVAFALEAVTLTAEWPQRAGARPLSWWRPVVWTSVGAGIVALLMLMPAGRTRSSEPQPLVATTVRIDGLNLGQPGVHFAVAPSGRTVVFARPYAGTSVLYRRDLDRLDAVPIVGTDGGSDVFFSPDGRSIGFEHASQLWTAPLDGGSPQMLLRNQPLRGGTWGQGDRIVFGRVGSGLWTTSATGGEPRQLTSPAQGERHELPQLLPGGRAVLFTILASNKPPQAAVYVLETGKTRPLFEGINARFVRSGHVVFGRQGKLWAVGFDPDSFQTFGAAHPVRDDVLWSATGYPQFAVDAGVLAYMRTGEAFRGLGADVVWLDRKGMKHVLPIEANNFMLPRWSPTGERLVVQVGASRELWTYDLRRGTLTRLTSDRIVAWSAPTWNRDGSRVVFVTWFDGDIGLGWVPADGSGPVEVLVKGVGMRSYEGTQPTMLPDGSGVILTGLAPTASVEDLLLVRLAGESRLETLLQATGVEKNAAIAPSGRFIAYDSDESRRSEVYVRPFPDVGSRKWQISTEGGAGPVWTRGGSEIVYQDGQRRIVAVAVRSAGNDELDFSKPEPLFIDPRRGGDRDRPERLSDTAGFDIGRDRGWDVTPDGERFLFLVPQSAPAGAERAPGLTWIQNWADELKRLVPRERR